MHPFFITTAGALGFLAATFAVEGIRAAHGADQLKVTRWEFVMDWNSRGVVSVGEFTTLDKCEFAARNMRFVHFDKPAMSPTGSRWALGACVPSMVMEQ
jgi:hypothetical protein